MSIKLTEDTLAEQPVIDWLKGFDYEYEHGPELAPGAGLSERNDFHSVLLLPRLQRSLRRLNPDRTDQSIDEAIRILRTAEHPSPVIVNRDLHKYLTEGISVEERKDGEIRNPRVRVIDFDHVENNEFLVVNQFAIQGPSKVRRPDVLVFVNGIPLVIFEVKSPKSLSGTIGSAYRQLQEYKQDIPDLFKYNQIMVVSDLTEAKYGTISSAWERFGVWKGIENENEERTGKTQLEILVKGMFEKERLLDIMKNYTVFEADKEDDASTYTKKMALYHQYFGVNRAVQQTLRAAKQKGNKKIGVFWHTQGSGKSLSMVFYVNKVKELSELKSPTIVFLTDRNDLDGQLHKTFKRTGYPNAKQADSISDLKENLRAASAGLVFTTIQKFDTKQELLSDHDNIIVIADEAHRSQYKKLAGNVRNALPNASFMGITGTPISLDSRDTRLVFGDYISTYTINQAVVDKATVPIYYEGRLVPLHLTNQFIDEEFKDIVNQEFEVEAAYKKKWARLEQAVGATERVEQVAEDIIQHFNQRGLEGKGMVVAMSRKVAVDLYHAMLKQPNAPEIAVVISNPDEFADQIQPEHRASQLEKRFKKVDDPLKLVIVCDMWLTGFDVPLLHTMYIDKPLKNHSLMQTIARVNRVYKDKPGGLIVDYIGIADDLKKALSIYGSDIRKEALIPIEDIVAKMMEEYDIVCGMFPSVNFKNWKTVSTTELTEIFQSAADAIVSDEETGALDEKRKELFLNHTTRLSKLHALVMPHQDATKIVDEIEFFQALKQSIIKQTIIVDTGAIGMDVETAVRQLISKSISAEGVIDIFDLKKHGKPDISIFDEKFIEEVKKIRFKNLAIETLRKLLDDEINARLKTNVVRYESLGSMLRETIEEYENKIINSSKVIERLIELAQQIKKAEDEGKSLGLSSEEVAFYDLMSQGKKVLLKNGELKDFVKELVQMIRRDTAVVDWSNNEQITARLRANVRLLLLQKKIPLKEAETILELIFSQARMLYRDRVPEGVKV